MKNWSRYIGSKNPQITAVPDTKTKHCGHILTEVVTLLVRRGCERI
jgi:hypothetical protein